VNGQLGHDAIHANVEAIPVNAPVVMGYDTGTPDIKWTAADWARFTTPRKVHIDQGGRGSPVLTSTVRDVETGAWSPEMASRDTKGWNPARPTIYCNQSTLPRVLAAGWRGDLWLAEPTGTPPSTPPIVPNCTVVAVQYAFLNSSDLSVVFDHDWPQKGPLMSGTQYTAPAQLHETVTKSLAWQPVPDVDGKPPTGYTVELMGLDGHVYFSEVTDLTHIDVPGLVKGWQYNVHVWANGGEVAPPHSALLITT
jgi:hypothetical protein